MDEHPGDRLTAYVDGTLPSEEAAGVAAHLAECAQCHAMLEDLLAVRRLLRDVAGPEPHPSLLPRTLARLEATRQRRLARPRWTVAGVALGAVGLAVLLNLPSVHGLEAGLPAPYFQQYAEAAMSHPLADMTLAGYLTNPLPYEWLGDYPAAQDRP